MSEFLSIINTAHRALDYHARRENLLASNLANVDTPGFRALELLREPAEEAVGTGSALPLPLPLQRTRAEHMVSTDGGGVPGEVIVEDRVVPVGSDGNGVGLEREMAKLSANDIRYDTVAGLVRKKLGELRYVAVDGRS